MVAIWMTCQKPILPTDISIESFKIILVGVQRYISTAIDNYCYTWQVFKQRHLLIKVIMKNQICPYLLSKFNLNLK